jgi:acyl-CoA reductase-like NAD-dependent aldehyde dehydrogenase
MVQPLKKEEDQYFKTISPIDDSVYLQRRLDGVEEIQAALNAAEDAQLTWAKVPLPKKQQLLLNAIEHLLSYKDEIAKEITHQIGRPISQSPFELNGLEERARYMIDIAPKALEPITPDGIDGFKRFIKREPLGIVAIIAPWNYPYLTSINGIVPALLAGNCVILKHSLQTPLVADRYLEAFDKAGLPKGVFQKLDLTHKDTENLISDARVNFVNFTGSVKGGHAIQKAISNKFISAGLELGGKDPAYVREDADINLSAESLVDGAFFNSGQSCCGIERIYVHENVYDAFVSKFSEISKNYKLGDPLEDITNIGPMVSKEAADFIRSEIKDAITKGASLIIDESRFPNSKEGTPYLAPQALINVDHSMSLMTEENFGPVVGIMKVTNDEEAIKLMNDSEYGLTASIWSKDLETSEQLAEQVETGTVFVNRCDYLDPALAWTGVKNSGRGCTLSSIGFEHLTRPKSFHIKEL